jgi:hypothetical protein
MHRTIIFILLLVLSQSIIAQVSGAQESNTVKPAVDMRYLRGAWWYETDKDSPHPTFEIDSAVVRYPDEHEHLPGHQHTPEEHTFKYQIQDDNFITYFGRFNDTAQIIELTAEKLKLKRGDGTETFVKPKK